MKPDPKYQDSGVESIGDVPEHWKSAKLKYSADVVLGKMLVNDDKGGMFSKPYLRAANLQWFKADISDVKEMWFSGKEIERLRLKKDDLLMSEGGEVGRTCIWNEELDECYLQNSIHKITFNQDNNAKYHLYQSYVMGQLGYFDSIVNRISIAHLTGEKVKEIYFLTPPFQEQTAIAAFLDRKTAEIDSIIFKKERLIELYKEDKAAVINHAVTKGLDHAANMKDSGIEWLGKIPEHWEVKRLKHISEVRQGVTKGRDLSGKKTFEFPYLRVANVQDGYLDLSEVKMISILENELDRFLLKEGDVLMNEDGDNDKLGRGAVWNGEIGKCLHQNHVFSVRPFTKSLGQWISLWTSSATAKIFFFISGKQTTNLASLLSSSIKELSLPLPNEKERKMIILFLNQKTQKIDAIISKFKRQIELLKEYRTALISEAVTGKIDVRENMHN